MNHTPTPWTNNGDCLTAANGERYLLYFPVDNHARMAQSTDPESAAFGKALLREDGANAAFITRACNAHEALVAALEDAVERLARVDAELLRATGQPFEYEIGEVLRGRAALKLATGE